MMFMYCSLCITKMHLYLILSTSVTNTQGTSFNLIFTFSTLCKTYNFFFQRPVRQIILAFILTGTVSILLSFLYSIIYIAACCTMGGAFPIFELIFAVVDLLGKYITSKTFTSTFRPSVKKLLVFMT